MCVSVCLKWFCGKKNWTDYKLDTVDIVVLYISLRFQEKEEDTVLTLHIGRE